jgi:hypothetical protein
MESEWDVVVSHFLGVGAPHTRHSVLYRAHPDIFSLPGFHYTCPQTTSDTASGPSTPPWLRSSRRLQMFKFA